MIIASPAGERQAPSKHQAQLHDQLIKATLRTMIITSLAGERQARSKNQAQLHDQYDRQKRIL